jgi:hypothetical protein
MAMEKDHHLKNNPFGKGDPRFDYQKPKVNFERNGPTGDFNIHMQPIKDQEIDRKREAIQKTLQF